jgi:hypothetical protein
MAVELVCPIQRNSYLGTYTRTPPIENRVCTLTSRSYWLTRYLSSLKWSSGEDFNLLRSVLQRAPEHKW